MNGGNAINGAVAAGIGEAGAYYLTKALYNKDNPETLTEEQKKSIADLSKVAGGVAAGLSSATTGGNSLAIASSVGDGMGIAENAVENNFLSEASRQRFNELIIKRSSGKELTEKEKFEILELAYFDQRSDVLARKYQRGEKLTPLEKLDLDRFVERFINETVSGRTDFGRGEKYTSGADVAVANLILGEKYLNNIGYKPNYSYPYVLGHTGEWRNKSDWKTDETIYREVFNELNNRPNLPQTWQELVQEMQNAVVAKGRSGVPNATNFSIRVPKKIIGKDQVVITHTNGYETQKVDLAGLRMEISKQNKHIVDTNEYKVALANGEFKSTITVNLDSLKGYVGTGQQVGKNKVGIPGSKERVNFNKVIGNYFDQETGKYSPTTMGIIHYSKNGYHVVPAKPENGN
ncbi:polymorphic toxin type 50 domain-containing protein [Ursidibacter sp. B-7004-1]